jgi:hypothetical protein
VFLDSARCCLCDGAYAGDERVCFRCGSTRVLSQEGVRLGRNASELVTLMTEWEANADARPDGAPPMLRPWLRVPTVFSFGSSGSFLFLAHGGLRLHRREPVVRGGRPPVLRRRGGRDGGALPSRDAHAERPLLTAAMWDRCSALITSQGFPLTPLDAVFCIVGLIAAAAPTDFLPRNLAARSPHHRSA